MDADLHGQPLQLKEVVRGIVQDRGTGAWGCAYQQMRNPSLDHPEGGEERFADNGGKAP